MKRLVSLWSLVLLGAAWSSAQSPPVRPGQPRPSPAEAGAQGEQKLRWVCKQLRLDAAQMQKAEALIEVYKAELEEQKQDPAGLLQRIQDKYAEIRAAQADGDTDRVKKLQLELKEMAPGVQAENRFFSDLETLLTEEQKARLPDIRKKAETIGDVSLRPIHVLRAALKTDLTLDQHRQLEAILADFRSQMTANRPDKPEVAAERVDKLVQDIRAVLTPQQAQSFDKEVEELRNLAPPATPLQPPVKATVPPPATAEPVAPPQAEQQPQAGKPAIPKKE